MRGPTPPDIPPPRRAPPSEPEPLPEFEPLPEPEDDDGSPGPSTPSLKPRPTDRDIDRGLRALDKYFTRCAREHGGLDGTKIRVDFSVGGDGRPTESYARNPYDKTPLGRCVAQVIKDHGRFTRSRDGLADIRREITLHPGPTG
jgi:hypothetical protein